MKEDKLPLTVIMKKYVFLKGTVSRDWKGLLMVEIDKKTTCFYHCRSMFIFKFDHVFVKKKIKM